MTIVFTACVLFSALSVMLPGLVLLASINKTRFRLERGFSGNFLLSAALGAIWSALAFFFLYMIDAHSQPRAGFYARIALDVALIVILFLAFRPMRQVREILSSLRGGAFWLLLLAGMSIGIYSAFHFPHALDSGQLLWTQALLLESDGRVTAPVINSLNTVRWGAMIGYSGLIAPIGALFADYPLVTVAAGFKPLLLVLMMFVCHHVVLMLRLQHRYISTVLLVILMLLSQFGMYGVLELGKDSIFGILFSVAFLVTLCQEDVEKRGIELALLFGAAAVLGVIAVPYMLIALALWLLLAADLHKARAVMIPFFCISAPTLPVVIAGMLHKPYWLTASAYLVVVLVTLKIGLTNRFARSLGPVRLWTDRVIPALPLIFLAAGAASLPATADMPVWANVDGTLLTERRAPLDGLTGMGSLLLENPLQSPTIILGLTALLLMGLSRHVSKAMIAVAVMPLAAIALILVHFHMGLRFLSVFNQWDMIKDVPLWYGGALFSVFALGGIEHISRRIPRRLYIVGVLVFIALVVFCVYRDSNGAWKRSFRPVYYTAIGGMIDKDFSTIAEITWKRLRDRQIFVDSSVIPDYFYALQMYGGRPSKYSADVLKTNLQVLEEIAFAVPNGEVFLLVRYARRINASLEFAASLAAGTQALVIMKFDGKGATSLPDSPAMGGREASFGKGAYGVGEYSNFSFRWLQKSSTLRVPLIEGVACLTMEGFLAATENESTKVRLTGPIMSPSLFDLGGSSLSNHKKALITIRSAGDYAEVRLEADMNEIHFPNDSRAISWGIVSPVRVEPGKPCPSGG